MVRNKLRLAFDLIKTTKLTEYLSITSVKYFASNLISLSHPPSSKLITWHLNGAFRAH